MRRCDSQLCSRHAEDGSRPGEALRRKTLRRRCSRGFGFVESPSDSFDFVGLLRF